MDYASEQSMELEALEAILGDDLQEYDGTMPDGWRAAGKTYKVRIDPDDDNDTPSASTSHQAKLMELLFAHTPEYPDEACCYKLRSVQGLSDADMSKGMLVLHDVVAANLGMAHVYALVAAAKEWLQSKGMGLDLTEADPMIARKKEQDEDERRRAEARSHGVMVTEATFLAWKAAFDAEALAERAALLEAGKIDEKSQRLSGKAYFLAQATMVEDDEEAGVSSESSDEDENVGYTTAGGQQAGPAGGAGGDEEDEDEEDLDYDDDDDEGLLEEYVAPTSVVVGTGTMGRGGKK